MSTFITKLSGPDLASTTMGCSMSVYLSIPFILMCLSFIVIYVCIFVGFFLLICFRFGFSFVVIFIYIVNFKFLLAIMCVGESPPHKLISGLASYLQLCFFLREDKWPKHEKV